MNKLPNEFKIAVPQGHSKRIQQKLFSLGFKWSLVDNKIMWEDKPFLFVKDGIITHTNSLHWFLNISRFVQEITISELMSIEPDSSSNLEELKTLLSELTDDLKNLSKKIEEKL